MLTRLVAPPWWRHVKLYNRHYKKILILAAMMPNFPREKYGFAAKTSNFSVNQHFLRGNAGNIAARIRIFFTV